MEAAEVHRQLHLLAAGRVASDTGSIVRYRDTLRNIDEVAKQYRVGAFVRFNNAVMTAMLRAGVPLGSFAILTATGRKSGQPIQVPLVVFSQDGNRYLIAAYGAVNWVRNLRASGGHATLTRARRTEPITAVELPTEHAAAIFQASLRAGPPGVPAPIVAVYRRFFVLPYLDVDPSSPPEEFVHAAPDHPVFLITTPA